MGDRKISMAKSRMEAKRNSLWEAKFWKEMREKSGTVPQTVEEALLLGYCLGEGFQYNACGGLLNHEYEDGYFEMTSPYDRNGLPPLRLPFRAHLEFGKPFIPTDDSEKEE